MTASKDAPTEARSPATRRLALAIASGKDPAGVPVFAGEDAAQLADAVREIVREEIAVALGGAIIGLKRR